MDPFRPSLDTARQLCVPYKNDGMSLKECGKIFAHKSMKIHAYKSHTSSFLRTKFGDGALLKWILDPETKY